MPVIDMGVRYHMHKLAHLHIADLSQHMHQDAVLDDIPVVGRQDILRALIEDGI